MNFLNGKYLSGMELSQVKEKTLNKEKVKSLFDEFSKDLNVTYDDLKIQSYSYDFVGTGNEIFIANTTKLFIENKFNIVVTEGIYEGEKVEVVLGDKVAKENGEVLFKEYGFVDNDVVITEETPYTNQLEKEVQDAIAEDKLLPDQTSYVPGTAAEKIQPKGLFDFCLPGGYKWCGKGCGYQTGGGKPINGVDRCCRTHDNCYGAFKTNRCSKCDRPLIDCVLRQKGNNVAKSAIYSYFYGKCNLIIT
ncbi:MAG: hypothetical protein ACQEWU_03030 [Bacillota bacterium]|uniref:hypothetical protein n=1 Tax=unclassified Virgibacillus TaxID=2620237 RepID=UPI001D16CC92|nr:MULTISPECIES: hypothetical protein [unclassified Virgibacillus]MCC2251466.1 hypothetical protein [Virgibacillus sp. AGTR]MDY7044865.1 hypothetical protein [Virgibacillus sp. M23]